MLADYFGSCVLSIDTGSGEVFTVLPAADVSVKAVPFIRGKNAVIELVDGTRKIADGGAPNFHIDIEVEWKELGRVKWTELANFVQLSMLNTNADFAFYPVANAALTAPHADYLAHGVVVVPEFTDDLIAVVFKGKVRQRSAKLILKSVDLVSALNLPFWMLDEDPPA